MAFSLSRLVAVMLSCSAAFLTPEGHAAALKILAHRDVRNADHPETSPAGSVSKVRCLEDQEIRKKKNWFGGLINFTSWWNTNKPSLSLLNSVAPFQPDCSWLGSSRRQLCSHRQSRSGGWLCGFRLCSWNICPRWLQGTATCGGGTRNESKLFSRLFPP